MWFLTLFKLRKNASLSTSRRSYFDTTNPPPTGPRPPAAIQPTTASQVRLNVIATSRKVRSVALLMERLPLIREKDDVLSQGIQPTPSASHSC